MKNIYSDKFIELAMSRILDLPKSKVIMWNTKYPFLKDIRSVFEQTEQDDGELIEFYSEFINRKMALMEKARILAIEVNKRIGYVSDKDLYGRLEDWRNPIEIFNQKRGDCDDRAVLICYLLRLFGAHPWEVFVRAGDAYHPDGKVEGHANVLVSDRDNFYYLEGSFYPDKALKKFGVIPSQNNSMYGNTWFITNDICSYSTNPWFKFVK